MYKAIVIGVSMGGLDALTTIFSNLPKNFPVPIIVVQHLSDRKESTLAEYLDSICNIKVEEACEKQKILSSRIYIAPAGYHLLIDEDYTFALDEGEYVNYARPSIDVLFESAAFVYGDKLIAAILTGANSDGSKGLKIVKDYAGYTMVQSVESAVSTEMIISAMDAVEVDEIVALDKMADRFVKLVV